ncbi:hypothetical protein [Klebsiella pneumoniae]|uniref:hypothetical protein n=1 Tax=Klebsiella pneumoniae TaxID=573 RepID=UPI002963FAB9|nr:hypothetical protein [Klebsiella pneumoniae]MDW1393964.1 hypothetical protein [Klebsiella pneumoniae]
MAKSIITMWLQEGAKGGLLKSGGKQTTFLHFAGRNASEPVAYMYDGEDGTEYNGHNEFSGGGKGIPLYRHAQQAPVVPDGYVMVPKEPTKEMLDEFDSIIDYGAEDSQDAWRRLLAAAPQEVKGE